MKKAAIALALVLASVALVACGSSGGSSVETETESAPAKEGGGGAGESEGASGGATIDFEADPGGSLAYTQEEVTAKAGKVTIDFKNPQPLPHDVAIEDSSGEAVGQTEQIAEGEDSTVVDLKPGTYKFFCTVPGHRQAGMEGTLVVK